MTLVAVTDPADDDLALFTQAAGRRFVAFDISIHDWRGAGETVPVTTSAFHFTSDSGSRRRAIMVAVDRNPWIRRRRIKPKRHGHHRVREHDRRPTPTAHLRRPRRHQHPRRGQTIDWNLT